MSLDITILDRAKKPIEWLPIGVDEHWDIIEQANAQSLTLWVRMSDYYEDAHYGQHELSLLAAETARLYALCRDPRVKTKLRLIEQMLQRAIHGGNEVCAIAD